MLNELNRRPLYWVLMILIGLTLEGSALYYQYVLDEWPCVLCIHVRIWVVAFILLAVVAIFCTESQWAMRFMHGANLLIMLGLAERSWQVLAVERGWIFGDCSMDLGMPEWFALDKWMPALFEVQTTCGYTPLILFDISMAEILLVISVVLVIIAAASFAFSWHNKN